MIKQLKTPWSDTVGNLPLPEYPRPQFVRDSFLNLNGYWKCAFTASRQKPETFDQDILVPFSPESLLSGVNRGRVILHFGAADQSAVVYINGQCVGTNEGGYYPFSFDITDYLKKENEITVRIRDLSDTSYYERGKQKINRGGIWYTPQSGLWQTVWLESVPQQYLENVRITPDYKTQTLNLEFIRNNDLPVETEISLNGKLLKHVTSNDDKVAVLFEEIQAWSPCFIRS